LHKAGELLLLSARLELLNPLDEEPVLDELPAGTELELPGNHFSSHSFSLGNSKDGLSEQDKKKITVNPNTIFFLMMRKKYTKK